MRYKLVRDKTIVAGKALHMMRYGLRSISAHPAACVMPVDGLQQSFRAQDRKSPTGQQVLYSSPACGPHGIYSALVCFIDAIAAFIPNKNAGRK